MIQKCNGETATNQRQKGGRAMPWEFREDAPIYTQLIAQIQQRIVGGLLGPGARLPSVRDLAAEAGVNPNTMQRALTELEREGIVHSQRTAGRFVTEDAERIRRLREELARQRVKDFLEGMFQLGFRRAEILALITQEADENAEGEEKTP